MRIYVQRRSTTPNIWNQTQMTEPKQKPKRYSWLSFVLVFRQHLLVCASFRREEGFRRMLSRLLKDNTFAKSYITNSLLHYILSSAQRWENRRARVSEPNGLLFRFGEAVLLAGPIEGVLPPTPHQVPTNHGSLYHEHATSRVDEHLLLASLRLVACFSAPNLSFVFIARARVLSVALDRRSADTSSSPSSNRLSFILHIQNFVLWKTK